MKITEILNEEVSAADLPKEEIESWFKSQINMDVTLTDQQYKQFLNDYDDDQDVDEFEEFLVDFAKDNKLGTK